MNSTSGHPHDVIVLGASAGGVEALTHIVRGLPGDLPAALFRDGTAGTAAVKKRGGVAVAQDPHPAPHAGMPRSAIESAGLDHVLLLSDAAPMLVELVGSPAEGQPNLGLHTVTEMEDELSHFEEESAETG